MSNLDEFGDEISEYKPVQLPSRVRWGDVDSTGSESEMDNEVSSNEDEGDEDFSNFVDTAGSDVTIIHEPVDDRIIEVPVNLVEMVSLRLESFGLDELGVEVTSDLIGRLAATINEVTSVDTPLTTNFHCADFSNYSYSEVLEMVKSTYREIPDMKEITTIAGSVIDRNSSFQSWNEMSIYDKRLFISTAQIWLSQSSNKLEQCPLICRQLARAYNLDFKFVCSLLKDVLPNFPVATDVESQSISFIIKKLSELTGRQVGVIPGKRKSKILRKGIVNELHPVTTFHSDESLMCCTYPYLMKIFKREDALSDLAPNDIIREIQNVLENMLGHLRGQALYDIVIRVRELVASYTAMLNGTSTQDWKRYIDVGGKMDDSSLLREEISLAAPMRYSSIYPSTYKTYLVRLSLGLDLVLEGSAHIAVKVNHPFLPMSNVTRFTVIQVWFKTSHTPDVLMGLIQNRLTSFKECYLNFPYHDKGVEKMVQCRLGYDLSFFVDGWSFVFIHSPLRSYAIPRKTGLVSFALPVICDADSLSMSGFSAPSMIIPLILYASLKRAMIVYDRSLVEMAMRWKNKFDPNMVNPILSLNHTIMHADMTFSGLRCHLATMLALAYEKAGGTMHSDLSQLVDVMTSGLATNKKFVEDYFASNFGPLQLSPDEVLARVLGYFHVITTLKTYTTNHVIFRPSGFNESFKSLSTVDGVVKKLDEVFSNKDFVNTYISKYLLSKSMRCRLISINHLLA